MADVVNNTEKLRLYFAQFLHMTRQNNAAFEYRLNLLNFHSLGTPFCRGITRL